MQGLKNRHCFRWSTWAVYRSLAPPASPSLWWTSSQRQHIGLCGLFCSSASVSLDLCPLSISLCRWNLLETSHLWFDPIITIFWNKDSWETMLSVWLECWHGRGFYSQVKVRNNWVHFGSILLGFGDLFYRNTHCSTVLDTTFFPGSWSWEVSTSWALFFTVAGWLDFARTLSMIIPVSTSSDIVQDSREVPAREVWHLVPISSGDARHQFATFASPWSLWIERRDM